MSIVPVPPAAALAAAQVMRAQAADPALQPQPWERLPAARQQWWLDRATAVLADGLAAMR